VLWISLADEALVRQRSRDRQALLELDAERDVEGILALFSDDATVINEGEARSGNDAIRGWRTGAASKWEYTTTIMSSEALGEDRYRVNARLEGNFPAPPLTSTTTSQSLPDSSDDWRSPRSVVPLEQVLGNVDTAIGSARPDRRVSIGRA
jgi:hypothetical protein